MRHLLIVGLDDGTFADIASAAQPSAWQVHRVLEHGAILRTLYECSPQAVVIGNPMLDRSEPWQALSLIREVSDVPILALTTHHDSAERIAALKHGADDAVSRTTSPAEIILRLEKLAGNGGCSDTMPPIHYEEGSVLFDTDGHRIVGHGMEVLLTPMENKLLACLLQDPDRYFATAELAGALWGEAATDREEQVKVRIHRLRRKIAACQPDRPYIVNRRTVGYRFHAHP